MADFSRWDTPQRWIGASSHTKPTAAPNGTIAYEVDTMRSYVYFDGTWYDLGTANPVTVNV